MMKLRETIHHGDYVNVRDVEIEPTFDAFVTEVLPTSPYNAGHDVEWYRNNKYVVQAWDNIVTAGRGEFGWATYTVLTPVRVLFRVDKYGAHKNDVVAVFDHRDDAPYLSCYEHHGQHGRGSLEWLQDKTQPATPEQYAPLLAELGSIGYDVTVGRRLMRFYGK